MRRSSIRTPQVRCFLRISTPLVDSPFLLPPHSTAEDLYSEGRDEYTELSNDRPSIWSDYNTRMSTSPMPGVAPRSPLYPVGQQSAPPSDDEPHSQYSYPVSPQNLPPYQVLHQVPYTDYELEYYPAPPPVDVSGNHPRDERLQPNPYGDTSVTDYLPDVTLLPDASHSWLTFRYPIPYPHRPYYHSSVSTNIPTIPSTGTLRRDPASVERTATGSSTHATASPYPHHPPVSDTSSDHSPSKQWRKRADPEQFSNKVYARTTFPSPEQRQELAVTLNMTLRDVQYW